MALNSHKLSKSKIYHSMSFDECHVPAVQLTHPAGFPEEPLSWYFHQCSGEVECSWRNSHLGVLLQNENG